MTVTVVKRESADDCVTAAELWKLYAKETKEWLEKLKQNNTIQSYKWPSDTECDQILQEMESERSLVTLEVVEKWKQEASKWDDYDDIEDFEDELRRHITWYFENCDVNVYTNAWIILKAFSIRCRYANPDEALGIDATLSLEDRRKRGALFAQLTEGPAHKRARDIITDRHYVPPGQAKTTDLVISNCLFLFFLHGVYKP